MNDFRKPGLKTGFFKKTLPVIVLVPGEVILIAPGFDVQAAYLLFPDPIGPGR